MQLPRCAPIVRPRSWGLTLVACLGCTTGVVVGGPGALDGGDDAAHSGDPATNGDGALQGDDPTADGDAGGDPTVPGPVDWSLGPGIDSLTVHGALPAAGVVFVALYDADQGALSPAAVRAAAQAPLSGGLVANGQFTAAAPLVQQRYLLTGLQPDTPYHVYVVHELTSGGLATSASHLTGRTLARHLRVELGSPAPGFTEPAVYGYYLYLPPAYFHDPAAAFPLLLFLHGLGEQGNGTTELGDVTVHGPPKLINAGASFPAIVVSPQSPVWWSSATLDTFITYLQANLRTDLDRLYVTGLSMGGGGTWAYATAHADRIAAIAPVCGASTAYAGAPSLVGKAVWAFHNRHDGTVACSQTSGWINAITNAGGTAYVVYWDRDSHDAWTWTYDEPRLWEWLWAQTRGQTPSAPNTSGLLRATVSTCD